MSLGNHEFDNGISGLTSFIKNITCPIVAANLDLSKVPELQAEKNLVNSVVLDVNGTKVGIIGYLTPDTKTAALKNDVEYIPEVMALEKEAAKLKSQGVKILIGLGHSGYLKDLEIAKKVTDIDLVIGGHSHTFLWNGINPDLEIRQGSYPTLVLQESGRVVPVVQAYAYTKYLGKLHMVFNFDGEIIHVNGNPILLDNSIPEDALVAEIVKDYHENVQRITERIIGKTSVTLDGDSCRLVECNMANFITDTMVHKYASEYVGDGWSNAPIAIINGGAIRTSIKSENSPTSITQGDIMRILPFEGSIYRVSVNGSDIKKMLEHSVAKYDTLNTGGQFLQLSGIKVEYDLEKPPGKRVDKVHMRCGNCSAPEYFNLNETETYVMLATIFLAKGGDGYSMLADSPSTAVDFVITDSVTEYLKKYSPINASLEGRIIIKNIHQ